MKVQEFFLEIETAKPLFFFVLHQSLVEQRKNGSEKSDVVFQRNIEGRK